ncbi:MAG TPA: glycosyltransferase family 1 protein [Patescibacteria group bacterium]|nr:glycosyltransferase family 1 protein [Patescibacteria group bacterium]
MRIGIDARMYGAKSTTGIGVYIKNLTDELFKIDQNNQYFLFMLDPAYSKFQPPSENIKKIKVNCPWYSWAEQIKMPLILWKYRLDLVHFPHFNVPIFYPKKFIVTIHDITPNFFPGPKVKKSLMRKFGYQVVMAAALKKSKKIIVISSHTKENLINHFKVKKEKIEVIYLGGSQGLNHQKIDQGATNEMKKKYKITKPFLFYLGVWRDHKNLPGLIKAFEILKTKFKLDFQLVLGGQPDSNYPEILEAINNSKFKNDIIAPGFIEQNDLPVFYQAAEIFVLPSFGEGFGLVALESLALGTPMAASKTTSLPEILGEAALYFNPADSEDMAQIIHQISTNQNLRQILTKNGYEIIKKYSWQTCAQKTLAVYHL